MPADPIKELIDLMASKIHPEEILPRKLDFALRIHAAPQSPRLQHAEERTCAPARDRLLLTTGEAQIRDAFRQAGAAVFLHDGLRRVVPPTDQAAFVDRVKRIDEHQRSVNRQALRRRRARKTALTSAASGS